MNYQDKLARKEQELREKHEQAQKDLQKVREREERAATLLFKKAMRRTAKSKSPGRRHTEMQMISHRAGIKQADNYDSNMFPLTKTDSLEEIMHLFSGKT